jgi:hypothetical protein
MRTPVTLIVFVLLLLFDIVLSIYTLRVRNQLGLAPSSEVLNPTWGKDRDMAWTDRCFVVRLQQSESLKPEGLYPNGRQVIGTDRWVAMSVYYHKISLVDAKGVTEVAFSGFLVNYWMIASILYKLLLVVVVMKVGKKLLNQHRSRRSGFSVSLSQDSMSH